MLCVECVGRVGRREEEEADDDSDAASNQARAMTKGQSKTAAAASRGIALMASDLSVGCVVGE